MKRYIPKSAWTSKKPAKHLTIAKAKKAQRAAKAWKAKSK